MSSDGDRTFQNLDGHQLVLAADIENSFTSSFNQLIERFKWPTNPDHLYPRRPTMCQDCWTLELSSIVFDKN